MKIKGAPPSDFESRVSFGLRLVALRQEFGFRISGLRPVDFQTSHSCPLQVLPLLLALGCTVPAPLRGGRASLTHTPAATVQTLSQGDNPSQPTTQTQETIRTRTYFLPAISSPINPPIQPSIYPAGTPFIQQSNYPAANASNSPVGLLVSDREEIRSTTQLGAAQKDASREFAAKLSSLRPITWVGVVLLIFGLVSFAWPPLRVIIASTTTSAAITLGGLVLIVFPSLIVGNEVLILGAVFLTLAAWFLAHRHGHLRGQLSASARTTTDASPKLKVKN